MSDEPLELAFFESKHYLVQHIPTGEVSLVRTHKPLDAMSAEERAAAAAAAGVEVVTKERLFELMPYLRQEERMLRRKLHNEGIT